ncbi:hypothetical protein [Hymenobacter psychrophilus]|uniref:hypothetical protein n=1 Tax=Hymenobacter psychrophilus TaxID=651662 RepID=UPI001114CC76|nr:hypothetical protein [Hymenobacter psychrophilus]
MLFHVALAVLFFFAVFKGPDPPLDTLGGDGVELNYGVDEVGSGDIQSQAPANESKNREDSRPPAAQPDPTPPQPTAQPDRTPPTEQRVVTSEAEESPVTVPPSPKPAPPREAVPTPPEPVRPKVDQRAVFTPRANQANGGGNGVNGSSNAPTGNNNGDNPGTVGDKGDPRGTYDGKAYSGEPGSGGSGSSPGSGGLDMSGWAAVNKPSVALIDNNSGFVKYKIRISADGDIEAVTKVSGNVSPAQDRLCREALEKVEFRRTSAAEGGATGFYTFRFTVR